MSLLKCRVLTSFFTCELSQPMGKTEFSSTAKNRSNSVSYVRKEYPFLELSDNFLYQMLSQPWL